MELLLQHGDHSRNGQGFLQEVDGAQQLVQRAMVRLTVPKGKFVLNPQLGSLLHTLGRTAPAQREQLALEYAQEALLEMPEVRVVAARCKQGTQADELLVKFELECTLADGQLARSVVEWRICTDGDRFGARTARTAEGIAAKKGGCGTGGGDLLQDGCGG